MTKQQWSNPRAASKIDKDLGERIRMSRLERNMSQQRLGEHLGVSFQQIQKYEKGVNRVSPAALTKIAEALHTTTNALLTGNPDLPPSATGPGMLFLTTSMGVTIAKAWQHIPAEQQRIITNLTVQLAGTHLQAAE